MPHKAVFVASCLLLCAAPAQAFHNSELSPETKQALIRLMDAFSAFGDSLAGAQRACAQGDQRACQYEQQGKAFVRQMDQGMSAGMAGRPGGMPGQGGYGMNAPPGGPMGGSYGTPGGPFGNNFGGGQGMPPAAPPNVPPSGGYGGGLGGGPMPGVGTPPPWGQGGTPMQSPNR